MIERSVCMLMSMEDWTFLGPVFTKLVRVVMCMG
jgi:hypothetical protein